MKAAVEDLERRRPVWRALSELYLDTELDDQAYSWIARVLAHSGYERDELREILFREVHPELVYNLFDLAGEWAGFDLELLETRILHSASHHGRRLLCRLLTGWRVREYWQRVCKELDQLSLEAASK